jgi:hypothetical protein
MKWKYDATTKFLRQMGNKIPMGWIVYKGKWKFHIVKCKICGR